MQPNVEDEIIQEFRTTLNLNEDDAKEEYDNGGMEEEEDDDDDDDDDEEEFSFMCGGANSSPIAAEDAFLNGQIKPVFPLFNRDLLFSGEDFPMRPAVKKVFVETIKESDSQAATSSSDQPACDWTDRKAVEASPEVCKKSNSTGFSKIWRFKDFLGRSNSDGRDAFVFLNNGRSVAEQPQLGPASAPAPTVAEKGRKKESSEKLRATKKKGKTASLSAHEVYLKSKAKEEDRRRSYLPYRPELMGFFTNVNGGLSKNVHPF